MITILRSYMSVERTRAMLGGRREGVGNVMAAGLGVVTPFCSCSAVPAFIGFVAAGVPLGVTLSFLIASPLVNEIAIGLLLSLFGIKVTALYIGAGLVIAIVAGWVLGRLRLERWVEPFVFETKLGGQVIDSTAGLTFNQRVQMGAEEVVTILRKIWPYLLVGIGLGAVIHGWAPEDFFTRYAGPGNAFGVLVAVAIGIPLYSNAAGILPLVEALHDKGLPMGTAAGVHDGRGRAVAARDDPAAPRPQAPAARHLRRCGRGRPSSPSATCSTPYSPEPTTHGKETIMIVKVLGPGCRNCVNLERATRQAIDDLGLDATVEKVTDYPTIVGYGVMSTPALVVDEKVVSSGRVPAAAEVRELLTAAMTP